MGILVRRVVVASRKSSTPGRRVQLHRAVSKLGWGSRSQAWRWIQAGEVCVDGRPVADPLTWVDLDRQRVTRLGQAPAAPARVVVALHKPRGVVTTRSDERSRRTVYDLLPPDLPWVFPAGRLDADSEGLLILTNDAGLSVRLTEPEHRTPKTYRATLTGKLTPEAIGLLRRGVSLSDGRTQPAAVRVLRRGSSGALVEIVLTEGRNRQVRRMAAAVGCKVRKLVRTAIGGYELGDLAPGEHRILDENDCKKLFSR
jgi:23S rRNA pseudouridine2605 synthase